MVQNGRPLGNMVIKLGLDSSAFSDSLTGAARATKTAVKEMQAGFKVADAGGNKLTTLAAKQEGLTKVIQAQKNELKYLGEAYQKTYDEQGNATSKTAKAAQKYNEAQAKLASYEAQLRTTTAQMARMRVETEGLTGWLNKKGDQWIESGKKITKFGDGVQKVGSTMTKALTVPLATGFTLATKKAADFQTQIGEIGPLLTNGGAITEEYRKQLDQMSDSSKKWAKQYGVSTTEINNGLAEIVRKGYDANQTMGVMPSILDATKASGEEFNDVMNVTTEVISQFGLKGKTYNETLQNTARVTDSLTYVANATSAGFSDLGLAMGYVGPVANSLGMEVEETAAAVGLLSDAGLGGEKAGTALRGALTRLLKPSEQNLAGFDKLGISVDEFKNGTLTLPEILDKIKTNTKGWTDAQRTAAIALAFGTESQSAMNVLVGQGGDALRNLTKETKGASGATKDIAKSMNDLPANKVARFKESLNVLAITVGEKLLPVVTPWIEKATDMVNKFSELDDATQQNIIKWGALAMAPGPAIKIIGSVISIFGKAKTGVGLLSNSLVELAAKAAEKKALSGLATTVSGVGTAATTAAGVGGGATGIAGLASGLAAVAGPAAIAVGAIAAVGLAAYAGKKAYDEHQLAGAKWGTAVTKEQDKVIEKSFELREDATDHVQAYADGVKEAATEVAKDNQKIVDSIKAVLDKEEKRKEKAAEGLQDEGMKKRAEAELKEQKEKNEKLVEDAKTTTTRINEIMANASNNNRELSTAERQFIQANYSRLSDYQLKAAGFTAKQRTAIETAYQKDLSNLSSGEYKKRYSAIQDSLAKEQKSFETQQKNLATIYGKNSKEYKDEMDILTSSHKKNTESLILGYARLFESQGYDLETNKAVWESYGWTVEEVQALVWQSTGKTAENLDMMAKGTKEADMAWNAMALDPKTGEVKTNMADTLLEMAKTDNGWSQLEFMVKNADLTTNAKEEIGIAMGEAGKWQRLSVEQKKLIVDGDEAKLRLYDSIEKLGLWDQYNADRKTLGVDNADAVWKLLDSEQKLNQWNVLPANEKQMLANNSDLAAKVFSSEEMWKTWGELPADIKKMFGDNADVLGKLASGEIALNSYQANNPALKKLLGDSTVTQNAARAAEEKLNLYSRNNPVKKNLQGNSASTQNAAKQGENALNDFNRNNPVAKNLEANDNASGPASEASRAVDTFSQKKDHTVTLTSIVKNVTQWISEKVGGNATGTNYHPGGPMMVNDQKGPLYRELVVRPSGESFIPFGRDVILPDEPKGTKVYTAAKTKRMVPQYAKGIGVPENSSLVQNLRALDGTERTTTNTIKVQADNSETEKKLDQLIKIMSRFGDDLANMQLIADSRVMGTVVTTHQNAEAKRKSIIKTGRVK